MDKRKLLVLAVLVAAVAVAAFVLIDTGVLNRTSQTAQESTALQPADGTDAEAEQSGTGVGTEDESSGNGEESSSLASSDGSGTKEWLKSEKVEVGYNTPEYELSLELCENSENRTFLRMQYYLNGATVVNELDDGDLPELAGIFESREKDGGTAGTGGGTKTDSSTTGAGGSAAVNSRTGAYSIAQALLDPVHSQLYLLIKGAPLDAFTQSSFYSVNLTDMSIRKLFSYPGLYGKMAFNKDFSMLAYSFGDPPHLSVFQEDNLLDVLDCSSGDYIIRGNRDMDRKVLGANSNPGFLYDYEFLGWQSAAIMKLKQAVRPFGDLDSGLTQYEVLYDIKKNLLLNSDGTEQSISPDNPEGKMGKTSGAAVSADPSTAGAGGAAGKEPAEKAAGGSEPIKALNRFYSYLASEKDYGEAMKLLDDGFKLRLELLKQFGAEELVKSDIDTDSASVYSDLLRAAKMGSIKKEETKDATSTVYYSQTMELGNGTQLEQGMTAQLKKVGKVWKIILIEDREP
jgi:hypothetical protein